MYSSFKFMYIIKLLSSKIKINENVQIFKNLSKEEPDFLPFSLLICRCSCYFYVKLI